MVCARPPSLSSASRLASARHAGADAVVDVRVEMRVQFVGQFDVAAAGEDTPSSTEPRP
jgi:uncharacterized protein YbjQ (UPF0145 family)